MLLGSGGVFQPVTRIYSSGSGTEIIPPGASAVSIEDWGGTGSGGAGAGSGCTAATGGGGGSGAYCDSNYSVIGQGGLTINWAVGAGGVPSSQAGSASTVTSGTFAITSMNSPGGSGGGNGSPGVNGSPGAGGIIATGGNITNSPGNPGTGVRTGGVAVIGVNTTGTAGGNGGIAGTGHAGSTGSAGVIAFSYT